jgi:mannose-6-phosphate isomerase-like protein (cupin superfamily)
MLGNPILSGALNHISLQEIKAAKGPPNWSHAVALADHVVGVVIYQESGTENDNHCHAYDEWWIVMEGEIDWVIEGRDDPVQAKAGDFVFVPARTFHKIFPKGDGPSVRVGVALPGHGHLQQRPERSVRVAVEPVDAISFEGESS